MAQLIINNNEFCAGQKFKDQIIDILYTHLFDRGADLENIYDEMSREINVMGNNKKIIKLYERDGIYIINKLNIQSIQRNNFVYAGHDLPVWRNDPNQAKIKIMVITQDPRRNEDEVNLNKKSASPHVISISTPFGLHSLTYRSHKNKGLVHYLFNDLQEELMNYNPGDLSIYYTDIYKFRGVASDDLDTDNLDVYKNVLGCEIEAFNPNVILLMGKEAQEAWKTIYNSNPNIIEASKTRILHTPHPTNARSITWQKNYPNKMKDYSSKEKRCMLLNDILKSLNLIP